MAVLARELSIQYGTYTVGGAQVDRVLERWYFDDSDYEKGIVEYTFLLRNQGSTPWTEAEFNTEVAAAEAAFRNPNQSVTITQGSETLKSWSHSSNTGMNARPKITKEGSDGDTGRSRRYKVRIEVDLPASPSSTSGRRVTRGSVNVTYSPSRRRTVTITPQYTALSSNSARDQYESAIAAYATSVLNGLGGTYKLLEEPQNDTDDQDKIGDFTRVYEEIIFTGVGSGDADVRGEELQIGRAQIAPGDTPVGGATVERLVTLTATYTAWIDAEQTTNLTGKWDSLFPSVVTRMRTILSGGSSAVIEATPQYDDVNNKITATVVVQGSTKGDVVEYRETVTEPKAFGKQAVGRWNGRAFSKYVFQGPGTWQRRVTQTYLTLGSRPDFTPSSLEPPAGMKKFEVSDEPTVTSERRGIEGYTMDLKVVSRVLTIEFYEDAAGGGGGSTQVAESTGDALIDAINAGTAPGQSNPAFNRS